MIRERGASFRDRDFLLALCGYFFLYLAVSLFFLYPVVLKGFGSSRGRIGLIMGVYSVVAIAVRPFFGGLIDRRGGRRFAVLGILVLLAATPFFHLVRDAGGLPVLLRALTGLGWGLSMTAAITLCSDMGPPDRLAMSMGIIGVAGLVANALGPLLAEELLRRGGPALFINASLLCLAAALGCILAVRELPVCATGEAPGGGRALRTVPWTLAAIIGSVPVFHGAIRGAMIYFVAVFAADAGLGRVGPFFVVFSLAAILTRFRLGDLSDRKGRKAVILPAALIIAVNLFVLAQVRSPGLLLATGFVGGLGQGLIFPALSTYLIDFLGRENKGLAISLYNSLFDVGMGLGAPFFGWISDLAGYRWMYRVAGLLLVVSTAVFMAKAPERGQT